MAIKAEALLEDYPQADTDTETAHSIACISICGPLEHHRTSWFFDSYDAILARVEAAMCDDEVDAVVMCIDSPGGDAAGTVQTHNRLVELKETYGKPLYAYANESMASAAYALGCAADELWTPETGIVGSVGVICPLADTTKANEKAGVKIKLITSGARKADSHSDREMTAAVEANVQSHVDSLARSFWKIVAKSRSMSVKSVRELEANVFIGQKAVDAGLADGVAGWYEFIEYVQGAIDSQDISGTSQETTVMKTRSQIRTALAAVGKKIRAAKSDGARAKLFAEHEKLTASLLAVDAKTSKYKKVTEEKEESDEEEEEDDDDDDDGDDDDDDDADAKSEDEEEEEEAPPSSKPAKKAKSVKASALSKASVQALLDAVSSATGESDVGAMLGALTGLGSRVTKLSAVEATVKKLAHENKTSKVTAMLNEAIGDGRCTPAQAKALKDQDPKWLAGYLKQQPKAVRSIDEGALAHEKPRAAGEIDLKSLDKDQLAIFKTSAAQCGMSLVDFMKITNERLNGSAS